MIRHVIETDFGTFDAPSDIPQMVPTFRPSWEDENHIVRVLEPEVGERTAFYQYVAAQGLRLRDGLAPQNYSAWKSEA